MANKTVSVRFEEKLYDAVQLAAGASSQSVNQFVNKAVEYYLASSSATISPQVNSYYSTTTAQNFNVVVTAAKRKYEQNPIDKLP